MPLLVTKFPDFSLCYQSTRQGSKKRWQEIVRRAFVAILLLLAFYTDNGYKSVHFLALTAKHLARFKVINPIASRPSFILDVKLPGFR